MVLAIVAMFLMGFSASMVFAAPATNVQMGSVRVGLSLNETTYPVGTTVEATLTLVNQSSEDAVFRFNTSQMHDFVVLNRDRVIWQWSHGRAFTQALKTLTLRPGESKVFQGRWDQRDARSQQVSVGDYEMVGVFPVVGDMSMSTLQGPRVRFRISPTLDPSVRPGPTVSNRTVMVAGAPVGEVAINGRSVLRIHGAAGGVSASERAERVASRLRDMLAQGLKASELTISSTRVERAIVWRGRLLVTADANVARLNSTTTEALARRWLEALTKGLSTGTSK